MKRNGMPERKNRHGIDNELKRDIIMETNCNFNMYVPTRLLFGAGELDRLHEQRMPGRKALIIVSNGRSTKANGYLARVEEQLDKAGIAHALFDRVEANPLRTTVMIGSRAAREQACDFILAQGGGSVMDASKAIAITTTAGTGSEADPWGVVTNEETHEKIGFGMPDTFPVLSIVDPELMTTVPPRFTAYQGFDALFHSTEAYISRAANLMSDMYALTAIENVSRHLAAAVKDGSDLEARSRVAFGNTLSGVVMTLSSCTSEHSLEHAMSAYHQELPHGAGLIMISKAYYTHFIKRHVCDDRFIRMARAMGIENASDPMDFIVALTALQEACGVADLRMSDFGIAPDEFAAFTTNARETMGKLFAADRSELSEDDCIAIYNESYK